MRNTYKEHLRVERLRAGDLDVSIDPKTKVVSAELSNDNKTPTKRTEVGGSND